MAQLIRQRTETSENIIRFIIKAQSSGTRERESVRAAELKLINFLKRTAGEQAREGGGAEPNLPDFYYGISITAGVSRSFWDPI